MFAETSNTQRSMWTLEKARCKELTDGNVTQVSLTSRHESLVTRETQLRKCSAGYIQPLGPVLRTCPSDQSPVL